MAMPVRAPTSAKLHLSPTNFPQNIEPTAELVRPPAKYRIKWCGYIA